MTAQSKIKNIKRVFIIFITITIITVIGAIGYLVYSYCSEPHTHSYKVVDNVGGATYTQCKCGDYYITDTLSPMCAHELRAYSSDERHIIECNKCNYATNEAHRYEICSLVEKHAEKCTICGNIRNEEEHSFLTYTFTADAHYSACEKCGQEKSGDHSFTEVKENGFTLTKCDTCEYVASKKTE